MKAALAIAPTLLCAALIAADAGAKGADSALAKRGERIFLGRETLAATIGGHELALPPEVAACAGCHKAPDKRRNEQFAPPLTRAWLTVPRDRRGGPPFAYDRDTFCKTVRTGMDPGYVILNRTMPRFALNDAQCRALWSYLSERTEDETPSPQTGSRNDTSPNTGTR
jgi:mono/diheme cytochrome c family protein